MYNTKNSIPLRITPHLANLLKYIFIDRNPRLNPMGIIKILPIKVAILIFDMMLF
ncbi:hypothetical protein JTT01_14975 [Clostridium botulinum]|nr:hypothetical protein [Clostridium botulinum]